MLAVTECVYYIIIDVNPHKITYKAKFPQPFPQMDCNIYYQNILRKSCEDSKKHLPEEKKCVTLQSKIAEGKA